MLGECRRRLDVRVRPAFLTLYRRACENHDAYRAATPNAPSKCWSLLSMEYGLLDCMRFTRAAWACFRAII